MKKFMFAAVCIFASVSLCSAQGLKIGGHGAYTVGGDVEEEEFGAGGQIGVEFNENFSLELSGTWIGDEANLGGLVGTVDVDFFTIALSARISGEVSEGVTVYGGGGINYNIIDIDSDAVNDPDDDAGFHACGGAELALGENLEFFAEYRFTWVEYDVDDSGSGIAFDETTTDYNFGMVRAGINIVL